eukprot:12894665-Prorocentrum_lima.AAC.1
MPSFVLRKPLASSPGRVARCPTLSGCGASSCMTNPLSSFADGPVAHLDSMPSGFYAAACPSNGGDDL